MKLNAEKVLRLLNAMGTLEEIREIGKQNPNEEVTNILNMIVPLMQSVNGMVQQQAPAKK